MEHQSETIAELTPELITKKSQEIKKRREGTI